MMFRYVFTLLTVVATTCASSASLSAELLLDEPLPIAFYEAPKLFDQCSRSAPIPDGDIWLPSKTEIATLEADLLEHAYLVEHIAESRQAEIDMQTSETRYRGQYVAFVRDNTRYIYASYVPNFMDYESYFLDLDLIPFIKENLDWFSWLREDRAVIICDGGPDFWGIVHNPATAEFSDYQADGGYGEIVRIPGN